MLFHILHCYLLLGTQFMSVDEIKPGMKGYGLSVFSGTKIDTFNVEIIDVMKKVVPKGNIILARLSGGIIDTAGVIVGMSGSPIYIYEHSDTLDKTNTGVISNPKLIGAIAYNYGAFPITPLAGITPIEEILNPPSLGYIHSGSKFCYAKIPIICPGLDDQILQEFEKELQCFDILRVQGSSGIIDDSIIPSPGASLGILLVDGDLTWYTIGTCTYTEGNKIWGFGHPMMALGKTDLPMIGGYVYSVVPSSYVSYKMAGPTKIIGTINNDNPRGISGLIGKIPELISFNLIIKGEKFHYRIVKEKIFLPLLFGGLTFYSIYTGIKEVGDMTAETDLRIEAQEGEQTFEPLHFHFKNLYTGTPLDITKAIVEVFSIIQNNPFQKIDIKEIGLNLTTYDIIKLAKIEEIRVNKKEISCGDTIDLFIRLIVHQSGNVKRHVRIGIPPSVKKGTLSLKVEDGKTVRTQIRPRLTTIDEIMRWMTTSPRDNEIVVTLTQKGESGWISGVEFHSLPPSVASFIKEEGKGDSKVLETTIPTEWVIMGKKSIELEVK